MPLSNKSLDELIKYFNHTLEIRKKCVLCNVHGVGPILSLQDELDLIRTLRDVQVESQLLRDSLTEVVAALKASFRKKPVRCADELISRAESLIDNPRGG